MKDKDIIKNVDGYFKERLNLGECHLKNSRNAENTFKRPLTFIKLSVQLYNHMLAFGR